MLLCTVLHSCEHVSTACIWRLKERAENVILLALILTDCLIKNCENTFPSTINKIFMDEIVYIGIAGDKGKRAEETAQK